MVKTYITTVSEISFDGAEERLSEYRLSKARRLKFSEQSIAAGLLLDYALREYGFCERDMEYGENEHGKPFFKNCPIKFSLSHSGEYAVCAVSYVDVGIDAEKCGDTKNVQEIAKRYFTAAEYEYVKNGDAKIRFFDLWTKKESVLKAIGTGIAGGLKTYEVLGDEITVGDTKFYFSEISGYENMSITVCAEEKVTDAEFVTTQMFKCI